MFNRLAQSGSNKLRLQSTKNEERKKTSTYHVNLVAVIVVSLGDKEDLVSGLLVRETQKALKNESQ